MKKWLIGLCFTSALAALAPLACTSTAANPYPDVPSFCAAKAKAECTIASTCTTDAMTCATVRTSVCTQDAAAAQASGTRSYQSNNVQACIDKINAVYSKPPVLFADLEGKGSINNLCERVFEGKADKGKTCTSDFDCIDGRVCSPTTPGGTSLVCANPVTLNATDFCSDPGSECPTGTFCGTPTGGAAQCLPKAAMGASCATTPCVEGLRCTAGICAAGGGTGATCASDADCSPAAGYCDPNASPPVCTVGLFTVSLGSQDCKAYSSAATAPVDASVPVDAAMPAVDAAPPVDAAPAVDGAQTD